MIARGGIYGDLHGDGQSVTTFDRPKSYAQHKEDLILLSALADVEVGFYIDVGASEPENDSVTKLFYDRGWSGVNIEPRELACIALKRERPRDVTLFGAASDHCGTVRFFDVGYRPHENRPGQIDTLSTTRPDYAANYLFDERPVKERLVPCVTLTAICKSLRPDYPIHFLKIDVEGGERAVLEGLDFDLFRPWIICIEAMVPGTTVPSHDEWERIILSNGYALQMIHEVNRYYVAGEHSNRHVRLPS